MDRPNAKTEAEASRITSAITGYLDAVTTTIDIKSVDERWAVQEYRKNRDKRVFSSEFVVIASDQLFLIAEAPRSQVNPRPTGMLYFWNNYLWPTYSLSFYWQFPKAHELISFRSYFMSDTPDLALLKSECTQILLLRGSKCIAAAELNLKVVNQDIWKLLDQKPPNKCLREKIGAKVLVHSHLEKATTSERHLEYGWATRLELKAREAIKFFDRNVDGARQENEIVSRSLFSEAFEPSKNSAAEIFEAYQQLFWEKGRSAIDCSLSMKNSLSQAPVHHTFSQMILICAWFSAIGTDRGKKLSSLDYDGIVTPVAINDLPAEDSYKVFWQRLDLSLPIFYQQILGSANLGIDSEAVLRSVPVYQGDVQEGEAFADDLMAEAVTLKQWTIPPAAYVQLEMGDIVAAKFHEVQSEVGCLLVNKTGEHLLIWIEPKTRNMNITRFFDLANKAGFLGHDTAWLERFELGIKILLAAIIRDFWVVEERERVFGSAIVTRQSPRITADRGKPILVYLPRVHYVGDVQQTAEPLSYVSRRAHFVIGHLRKAVRASDAQIRLAQRLAITVPEGFTFVRPHQRGDKAQERIYRSRSALQCMRAIEPTSVHEKDRWFQYEINVKSWLQSNGFEVEHLAANRAGDGGVDIQAYRNDEHLLVQCKNWQKYKIGPSIVREMLGTLQTFPHGARGVIITSTELTDGAKRLAIRNAIQFIERADFSKTMPGRL